MQAVWFSASADLAVDAKRDLTDVGAYKYDPIRIHDLRKVEKVAPGKRLEDVPVRRMGPHYSSMRSQSAAASCAHKQ